MLTLRALAQVVSLVAVVVVGSACEGGSGEGEGEAAEGEGEGEGGIDVHVGCDADDACDDGLVCELATRTCKAGLDCSVNPGLCGFCGSPGTNCGFGEAPAFCDVDGGSVCRRIKGACDACSVDAECGEGPTGLPSVCDDGFCAPGCGSCAPGFVCDGGGCIPIAQAGSCDTAIHCADGTVCPDGQVCSDFGVCLDLCEFDVECPAGSFCVTGAADPFQSTCRAGCPLGQTVLQDGQNLVCHDDGRFGLPCPTAGSTDGCPNGTECRADGVCERAGCQSDAECPLARTYCDVPTATCLDGCNDPTDCGAFELCEENQCRPQGCRSKDTSCDLGQFCCGQELFSDDTTCPAGVDDGACFLAPDPFCRVCEEDADCADAAAFGFGSFCYELTRQNPDTGEDESLGKFCSVGCRDDDDCPRGLGCKIDLPTPDGGTTQGCLDALCPGFR